MQSHNKLNRSIAVSLAVLLTVCNLPLMAADKTQAATIGSVTSVGNVQLRGVTLSNEGTLFSGDRLNVGPGAYARVAASSGQKLELGSNSDVAVTRDGDNTDLQMTSGNVSFKGNGKGSTRVRIGVYDVVASSDAAGNIAFTGSSMFGVRMTNGSATVRNTRTKQSFVVQKGVERLVSLTTGDNFPTMSQLASSVPAAVPAPRRQGTSSMSTATLVSIVAAAAGGASLVTYFLARSDDDERGTQVKALGNLNSLAQNASATAAVATQVSSVAGQAAVAISASSLSATAKSALQAQVTSITNSANAAAAKITTLNSKISALQAQIATQEDGPTAQQQVEINQLVSDLNSARTDVNNAIAALNTLLASAQAQGVTGLPANPGFQPLPPVSASASVPV
jgi:hypothetical protein